jgi:YggT family protein
VVILNVIATIAYFFFLLYFFVLWARFILDLARTFARNWRPKGFAMVVAELVFSLTDPPLRLVRRLIPPVRAGGVALDFAWSVVMLLDVILIYITFVLRYS